MDTDLNMETRRLRFLPPAFDPQEEDSFDRPAEDELSYAREGRRVGWDDGGDSKEVIVKGLMRKYSPGGPSLEVNVGSQDMGSSLELDEPELWEELETFLEPDG